MHVQHKRDFLLCRHTEQKSELFLSDLNPLVHQHSTILNPFFIARAISAGSTAYKIIVPLRSKRAIYKIKFFLFF
jgi:hypothetical protein